MSDRTDRIRGCLVADRWKSTAEIAGEAGFPEGYMCCCSKVGNVLRSDVRFGLAERVVAPSGKGGRTVYWRLAEGEAPPVPETVETATDLVRRNLSSEWRTVTDLTGLPYADGRNAKARLALNAMLEAGTVERRERREGKLAYEWRLKP